MIVGHDIHLPLAGRLADCLPYRAFYEQPRLAWMVVDYLDSASLARVRQIAPAYGVKTIVLSDGAFRWETELGRNPSVDNWLAREAAQPLGVGLLVATAEEKKRLEENVFRAWQVPITIFSREQTLVLDGTSSRFGGGRLPCLEIDQLVPRTTPGDIVVQVDGPGCPVESHAAWGNVFAVSIHLLSGMSDAAQIEDEYFRLCFGQVAPEVKQAFAFARSAAEKSLFTQGTVQMMSSGCWPETLEWFDGQLTDHPELSRPTKSTLARIDFEKIEGLEAAHDAWKVLDSLRLRMDPRTYLWLEHYFQHLKIICLVLRALADVYFSRRGLVQGSLKIASHVLGSKLKELVNYVEEYESVLMAFDTRSSAAGGQPLSAVIMELAKF